MVVHLVLFSALLSGKPGFKMAELCVLMATSLSRIRNSAWLYVQLLGCTCSVLLAAL